MEPVKYDTSGVSTNDLVHRPSEDEQIAWPAGKSAEELMRLEVEYRAKQVAAKASVERFLCEVNVISEGNLVNAARTVVLNALQTAQKSYSMQEEKRVDLAKWVILSMLAEAE